MQVFGVLFEIEVVVGGDLVVVVGYQGGLCWMGLFVQWQQFWVVFVWWCEGIVFDVEFDFMCVGQGGQGQYVFGGDVVVVWSWMYGDVMCVGIQVGLGGVYYVWFGIVV